MLPHSLGDFCPYKGLQPYTEADRAYFFGRERDQEIITSNLYAAPLTVLYGASGVGKSSVLMAGVMPQLRDTPRIAVVLYRTWQEPNFLQTIKGQTLQAVSVQVDRPVEVDVALPFDEFCQQCAATLHGEIFFIFDQFEEYFLYHADGENGFDAEFARAVNRREVPANFLLSMREDGLSRLDRFKGRIPNLLANLLRLEHLDRESAMSAIRNPLAEYNRNLDPDQMPWSIEDPLVVQVINQVRTGGVTMTTTSAAGGQTNTDNIQIETPYLQLVMTRLWNEENRLGSKMLRLATLRKLGGAQQIVRTHLDTTMARLSESEQGVAASAFRFMVTPSQAKIAYTVRDLADFAGVPAKQLDPVVRKLSAPEVRVLRAVAPPSGASQEPRYEIFHDVLAPAVLDWRERYLEQRRSRRLRLIGASVATLFLIFLIGTVALQWFTLTQATQRAEVAAAQVQATAIVAQNAAQSQVSQAQLSLQQQAATQTAFAQSVVRAQATQDAQAAQAVKTTQAQATQVIGLSQALLTPEARPIGPTSVAVRATAAAAGTSATQLRDFKVTDVKVAVAPQSSGTCPTVFNAVAAVATNLTGTVTYRWELSDGSSSPQGTLNFAAGETKNVTTTWSLAYPTSGWFALRIVAPNAFVSDKANFVLQQSIYPEWLRNKLDRSPVAHSLGCSKGSGQTVPAVSQEFQYGMMFWRGDSRLIYVLFNDSTWATYSDTWNDTQPASANLMPPAGLIEPVRGFGKVWREFLNGPSSKLGWASEIEYQGTMQAQDFDNGLVVRNGSIIVLLRNGKWTEVNEAAAP
ncbi:MAG: ATP-binding protein [Chloroflexi bacterium]|nr:ATP-binding protein [Chloroflexota bacterium]